jgi:hypothetical protein
MSMNIRLVVVGLGLLVGAAGTSSGQGLQNLRANQAAPQTSSICGQPVVGPTVLPPRNSGPVIYLMAPCFGRQVARMAPTVFLQDVRLLPSQPSAGLWVPYDSAAEKTIFEDFQRLWANQKLADLSVEIRDYRFSNGVIGKLITYNITER